MFILLNQLRQTRRTIGAPRAAVRGSLALRHIDAGSCNGCEHELTAAANPYYDLQQYGLNIVASPRHADVLLVTGALTTRMLPALRAAHAAMPEPRLVAALGDCALGRNVLGLRESELGLIALGRRGSPHEAAGPIFFLCSPWSNYVQGQVLHVTGGHMGAMTS